MSRRYDNSWDFPVEISRDEINAAVQELRQLLGELEGAGCLDIDEHTLSVAAEEALRSSIGANNPLHLLDSRNPLYCQFVPELEKLLDPNGQLKTLAQANRIDSGTYNLLQRSLESLHKFLFSLFKERAQNEKLKYSIYEILILLSRVDFTPLIQACDRKRGLAATQSAIRVLQRNRNELLKSARPTNLLLPKLTALFIETRQLPQTSEQEKTLKSKRIDGNIQAVLKSQPVAFCDQQHRLMLELHARVVRYEVQRVSRTSWFFKAFNKARPGQSQAILAATERYLRATTEEKATCHAELAAIVLNVSKTTTRHFLWIPFFSFSTSALNKALRPAAKILKNVHNQATAYQRVKGAVAVAKVNKPAQQAVKIKADALNGVYVEARDVPVISAMPEAQDPESGVVMALLQRINSNAELLRNKAVLQKVAALLHTHQLDFIRDQLQQNPQFTIAQDTLFWRQIQDLSKASAALRPYDNEPTSFSMVRIEEDVLQTIIALGRAHTIPTYVLQRINFSATQREALFSELGDERFFECGLFNHFLSAFSDTESVLSQLAPKEAAWFRERLINLIRGGLYAEAESLTSRYPSLRRVRVLYQSVKDFLDGTEHAVNRGGPYPNEIINLIKFTPADFLELANAGILDSRGVFDKFLQTNFSARSTQVDIRASQALYRYATDLVKENNFERLQEIHAAVNRTPCALYVPGGIFPKIKFKDAVESRNWGTHPIDEAFFDWVEITDDCTHALGQMPTNFVFQHDILLKVVQYNPIDLIVVSFCVRSLLSYVREQAEHSADFLESREFTELARALSQPPQCNVVYDAPKTLADLKTEMAATYWQARFKREGSNVLTFLEENEAGISQAVLTTNPLRSTLAERLLVTLEQLEQSNLSPEQTIDWLKQHNTYFVSLGSHVHSLMDESSFEKRIDFSFTFLIQQILRQENYVALRQLIAASYEVTNIIRHEQLVTLLSPILMEHIKEKTGTTVESLDTLVHFIQNELIGGPVVVVAAEEPAPAQVTVRASRSPSISSTSSRSRKHKKRTARVAPIGELGGQGNSDRSTSEPVEVQDVVRRILASEAGNAQTARHERADTIAIQRAQGVIRTTLVPKIITELIEQGPDKARVVIAYFREHPDLMNYYGIQSQIDNCELTLTVETFRHELGQRHFQAALGVFEPFSEVLLEIDACKTTLEDVIEATTSFSDEEGELVFLLELAVRFDLVSSYTEHCVATHKSKVNALVTSLPQNSQRLFVYLTQTLGEPHFTENARHELTLYALQQLSNHLNPASHFDYEDLVAIRDARLFEVFQPLATPNDPPCAVATLSERYDACYHDAVAIKFDQMMDVAAIEREEEEQGQVDTIFLSNHALSLIKGGLVSDYWANRFFSQSRFRDITTAIETLKELQVTAPVIFSSIEWLALKSEDIRGNENRCIEPFEALINEFLEAIPLWLEILSTVNKFTEHHQTHILQSRLVDIDSHLHELGFSLARDKTHWLVPTGLQYWTQCWPTIPTETIADDLIRTLKLASQNMLQAITQIVEEEAAIKRQMARYSQVIKPENAENLESGLTEHLEALGFVLASSEDGLNWQIPTDIQKWLPKTILVSEMKARSLSEALAHVVKQMGLHLDKMGSEQEKITAQLREYDSRIRGVEATLAGAGVTLNTAPIIIPKQRPSPDARWMGPRHLCALVRDTVKGLKLSTKAPQHIKELPRYCADALQLDDAVEQLIRPDAAEADPLSLTTLDVTETIAGIAGANKAIGPSHWVYEVVEQIVRSLYKKHKDFRAVLDSGEASEVVRYDAQELHFSWHSLKNRCTNPILIRLRDTFDKKTSTGTMGIKKREIFAFHISLNTILLKIRQEQISGAYAVVLLQKAIKIHTCLIPPSRGNGYQKEVLKQSDKLREGFAKTAELQSKSEPTEEDRVELLSRELGELLPNDAKELARLEEDAISPDAQANRIGSKQLRHMKKATKQLYSGSIATKVVDSRTSSYDRLVETASRASQSRSSGSATSLPRTPSREERRRSPDSPASAQRPDVGSLDGQIRLQHGRNRHVLCPEPRDVAEGQYQPFSAFVTQP